jgi:hypothetical protein
MDRLSLLLLAVVTASVEAAPAPFPKSRSREPDRYWRIDFSPLTTEPPLFGIIDIFIRTTDESLHCRWDLSEQETLDEVVATLQRRLVADCNSSRDELSLKIRTYKNQPITSLTVKWGGAITCKPPRIIKPQQEQPPVPTSHQPAFTDGPRRHGSRTQQQAIEAEPRCKHELATHPSKGNRSTTPTDIRQPGRGHVGR